MIHDRRAPLNILLIHQNYPGQYRHFLGWLVDQGGHTIVFLTQRQGLAEVKSHKIVVYKPDHQAADDAYPLSRYFESCCGAGLAVANVCHALKREGFTPDIVIGHSGWGETLFVKEVWPGVPVLAYFEYFYRAKGGAVGFDPEFPSSDRMPFIMAARNAVNHLSYAACDAGQTATRWQRDGYPPSFHDKIKVIHEGVRTDLLGPNPDVSVKLGRVEKPVTREDEVFTYIARNLEPVRGFHTMMRALPKILERRPNARALIIGGNEISYGRKSDQPGGFRAQMEQEVGDDIDWSRVHFLGRVPYDIFINVLQLTRCHIYLTVPFVLSWSLLEAMAVEATVVASDTAPVREVVEDGKTGLLVDFFSPDVLAEKVVEVLGHQDNYRRTGKAARQHVVARYDLCERFMPEYTNYINELLPPNLNLEVPEAN